MPAHVLERGLKAVLAASALALALAAPAHAVATIAADTTRSSSGEQLTAGRATSLTAGGADRTLLRFDVRGLGAPPARAVLRLRVTAPTVEGLVVRVLPPAFGEDDGTPATLAPEPAALATISGANAGTWAEWDVTDAVHGDGDVGLQVSGPLLDAASFSSREGADAPQLVVTPDDERGARLAGLLDPRAAETFVAGARDDLGSELAGLDVIAAPPGAGVPGHYVGVHHTLVGGVWVTKLATSDDLTAWTHRADLDTHASQPTLTALPDGGYLLALERDTPDDVYVSRSNLVVRHYASWAALAAGTFDRQVDLPRTLAETAEGTPSLTVASWNGPGASQIVITFHYLKHIEVDRQAAGVLTNFDAASWAPQPDAPFNSLFLGLGTRGNLGDRAELRYEGHAFAVVEAQSVRNDFGAWRWYLYDRERHEARLLALRGPAGSYALGNPTVRPLVGPTGRPLLFISGYAFFQGAGTGEAGQFIALRFAATDPIPGAEAPVVPPPAPAAAPAPAATPTAAPRQPAPQRAAADTSAPIASLGGAAQRLARTVAVKIRCADEACDTTTTGSVRVAKHGRVKAHTYRLKAVLAPSRRARGSPSGWRSDRRRARRSAARCAAAGGPPSASARSSPTPPATSGR